MSEEKLNVGVVGVGYLGSIHARIYERMQNVRLVGVMDSDVETGRRVAKECGQRYANS